MNATEFTDRLSELIKDYIAEEEAYTDNAQLRIDTSTWDLDIADPEEDLPNCDYYPMMDLVRMSAVNPGQWEPDTDAITEVAAEYVFTDC